MFVLDDFDEIIGCSSLVFEQGDSRTLITLSLSLKNVLKTV